jgi:hypothetical protein
VGTSREGPAIVGGALVVPGVTQYGGGEGWGRMSDEAGTPDEAPEVPANPADLLPEGAPTPEPILKPRRGSLAVAAAAGALVTLVVVGIVAYSHRSSAAPKHDLIGTFTLTDTSSSFTTPCVGTGGFSDITPGAEVTVSDGSGKVLAIGALDGGDAGGTSDCVFSWIASGVPKASFYKIEVSHRGGVTFSYADLSAQNWSGIGLTLGS